MAKSAAIGEIERALMAKRLEPVLTALKRDPDLRDEFLLFVRSQGGDMGLFLERLKTIWWKSRKSMYPGFFVFVLTEFAVLRGYLVFPRRKS
jgi:hypothetical protein